jgi:hypothetical protein
LGKVPVVKRQPGFDASCKQSIDEPIVESQSCFVLLTYAEWKDTGPSCREAIGGDAEVNEQIEVVFKSPVVVTRSVAVRCVP